MDVREAKEKDYEELMILFNDFVGEDRYSKHDFDSFLKVLKIKNNFVYVAEDSDKLIGFAAFSVRLVIRYPKPIAELDELYVMPEYRRKGVGKMLMNKVVTQAKKSGCYRLYIGSHYKHKAAHKFYESMAFINYGYHFMQNL
jgi:GNAT superfamily N-acetyltransferase